MFSIIEHIMASINSKHNNSITPTKSIYEQRIDCLKNLVSLQEQLKSIEGNSHTNAYERLEGLISEYKKEYNLCEKIIRPVQILNKQ